MILTEFYKVSIDCPQEVYIDTSMSITVKAYDYNKELINRNIDFEIITPSNNVLNYSTNSTNPYTLSYTPTEWGLYTIKCGSFKKQFLVKGVRQYSFTNGTVQITLYYNDEVVTLKVYAPSVATSKHVNKTLGTIPTSINGLNLRPSTGTIVQSMYVVKGYLMIANGGDIIIRNHQNSSTITEYVSTKWLRR